MPARSPLAALSRRVHAALRRGGIPGILQRFAIVVLPRPRLPTALLNSPSVEAIASRERARRALVEARHVMSGVIGNGPAMPDESTAVAPVLPDLERLQAYLEESDRDRAALREEVSGLRGMLQQVSAELDLIQQSIEAIPRAEAAGAQGDDDQPAEVAAAPDGSAATRAAGEDASTPGIDATVKPNAESPPAADSTDTSAVPAAVIGEDHDSPGPAVVEPEPGSAGDITVLRERVLRALRERVFAAGTVGTRVEIRPALPAPEAASVLSRMNEEALVELAEEGTPAEDATSLRVTLRAPLRWELFSALLEAALGRPLPPGSVGWSHGIVRVDTAGSPAVAADATPD